MPGAGENERLRGWKSQVRKACLAEDLHEVKRLLHEIKYHPEINDAKLNAIVRSAVQETIRTGKLRSTHLLLVEHDARKCLSGRQFKTILHHVIELKHPDDLLELLDCGGGKGLLEQDPDFARRLGLLAAVNGDKNSLWILSRNGLDIHAQDSNRQTLLIELACGKVEGKNSRAIVEWLASEKVDLNKKDKGERNALHWAANTGKIELLKSLLAFHADVDAPSTRGRTALHLVAAKEKKSEFATASAIAELLIHAKADVRKESDGGWTALHNASQVGNVAIVQKLLGAGANVNAVLSSGVTPLHWACTRGHEEVAKCLLASPNVRRHEEDVWSSTPMLRAAQNGFTSIKKLLSPEHDWERLSAAQQHICRSHSFQATVTDFRYEGSGQGLKSKVNKEEIRRVLYDPKYPVKIEQQSTPASKHNFRWIHLPANNMAWAKTLFTKLFVEEDPEDVDAFKALQKTFTRRHRGPEVHSTFMIPSCTSIKSSQWESRRPGSATPENRNVLPNLAETPSTPTPEDSLRPLRKGSKQHKHGTPAQRGSLSRAPTRSTSDSVVTLVSEDEPTPMSSDLRPRRKPGNIAVYMPFLHFEFDEQRQRMSDAIRKYRPSKTRQSSEDLTLGSNDDEILIQAYLDHAMSLQPRRTLDQSFYRGFDTKARDVDQVVYRYCKDKKWPLKIFMTDQLWLWIFGRDLLVTSFPQRWGQGSSQRNDPLNIVEGTIEDINSKTRPPVTGVADLAILIFSRCLGSFDRHRPNDHRWHFMDMFESSIGRLSLREPELFESFDASAASAAAWLREHPTTRSSGLKLKRDARELKFVDELLEIKEETKLLKELKDILDELHMIKAIFLTQSAVLDSFEKSVREQLGEKDLEEDEGGPLEAALNKFDPAAVTGRNYGFDEQRQLIKGQIADVDRMDDQAKAIFESLRQLLDFKQMHASSIEARFAREQAGLTARQGETIMVFTIVTIVFLPISFVASLFAINMETWSQRAGGLTLGYVSKFVFGIGLTISFVLIILAFMVGDFFKMLGNICPRPWPATNLKARVNDERVILAHSMAAITETQALSMDDRSTYDMKPLNRVTSGFSAASWRSPVAPWGRTRRGSARGNVRISEDQV